MIRWGSKVEMESKPVDKEYWTVASEGEWREEEGGGQRGRTYMMSLAIVARRS